MTSSRARRREKDCWGTRVTLAGRTAPFAFPLTVSPSSPRKMFSSVAHLARANPFNAPHLQLVYDGLAGPCSSPSGPPGPPRRSRNLAAAAVEGEVRPCQIESLCPPVVRSASVDWAGPGGQGRTPPARCTAGRRTVACWAMSTLSSLGQVSDPWPSLKGMEGPRHSSIRDLHVLKGVDA